MSNDTQPDMATQFQRIDGQLASGNKDAVCQTLIEELLRTGRLEEVFDARLIQARQKLGVPISTTDLDDVPEQQRVGLEEAYLDACREVGQRMLDEGRIRQAWMYLRVAGENDRMTSALEAATPNDENVEELIEIALYEGLHIERGFQLLLDQYGTCNAITTFESALHGRKLHEQQLVVGMLVRWLHKELLDNLMADLDAHSDVESESPISDLIDGRDDLFGEYSTHIDVSHLSSVVRFARILEDGELLRLALDLTEYGRRLHKNLQHEGDAPFKEFFVSHRLFFAAQLGQLVEEAVVYFRQEAEKADVETETTASVEVYIVLLTRIGRWKEAIEACATLIPPGLQTTGFAPTLLELSRRAGDYGRYIEENRQRGDLLGYAIGRLEAADGS